ncbi:Cys-tRNA(Pro) deacylase [Gracilinema caldarium]|uniref:Cys-tRNA(Pro)/Cys-tRNA(Cys) deacylase n=1 Tax=Gracilinema caldarium (strain ATCC 51460 / DSM 7334 / H1) TaxID=744872 RepID=F8F1H8_GRAC1|nr:Cys-tRNA(Pro) deacylase [Gracilinema caldarium]AEJ19031.1 ybaK/ebsC protein [Gracilinema caldarium DSM 7334]
MEKTTVIRMLEQQHIPFQVLEYEVDETDLSATHAAELLGLEADRVFKTIVLEGERSGYLVCVIPGTCEVDVKKAARAAGDKAVRPLPLRELEAVTGYIRGGCSPLLMKKKFPTYIDETALIFESISVSAGRRGLQILIDPQVLVELSQGVFCDLIG